MRLTKTILAATALSLLATPAMAQEEEPRTTYQVTMLEFADDADQNRWLEMRTSMYDVARERAGLPAETVHWIMLNPDWDLMLVAEIPEGMAAFDTHGTPSRMAFVEAMTELAGGEDELEALSEEANGMFQDRMVLYTHTHP